MKPVRSFLIAGLLAAAAGGLAGAGQAAPTVNDCQECHGDPTIEMTMPDGTIRTLFVDEKTYRASIHGKAACTACHVDAKAPHGELSPVSCGRCHPDAAKSYAQSTHGIVHAKGNQDVPGCED